MPEDNSVIDARIGYAVAAILGASGEGPFSSPPGLTYGPLPGRRESAVHVVASGFFSGECDPLPSLPLAEIEGVPLLFGKPLVERRDKALIVYADIVASAYFLLTRYEELARPDVRDEHGRFPGKESLPARAGFIDRPIVDEYAGLLRKWAKEAGVELPEPKRRFSVLLTHDVDFIGLKPRRFVVARSLAGGLLGRRSMGSALVDAAAALGLIRHPADNLDEVIRLDRRLTGRFPSDRCRSMFFFMAGGNTPNDGMYHLRQKRTRRWLQGVVESGAEIGLHASYEAGANPARVADEREELEHISGRKIEKNRHHFLAWREPQHGAALADAGIRWDATLGYSDVAGFRLGVCRPIPLFDPVRRRPLGIEEHPLTVMDCTLDRSNYMNLGEEEAFAYVRKLIDATYRHQGEFVCLWHHSVLAASDASYHKRLYPRILDYIDGICSRNVIST